MARDDEEALLAEPVYNAKLDAIAAVPAERRAAALTVFSGPSVDLHRWAMEQRSRTAQDADAGSRDALFRAIYAVLPAWGMHRMGPGGSKMPPYDAFRDSLERAWKHVAQLWDAKPQLDPEKWNHLRSAYDVICARSGGASGSTQIVSRSKVLAHLLPNLCAPIDRSYTLAFFGVEKAHQGRVARSADYEWRLYKELHERFFHRFAVDPRFADQRAWTGGFGRSPLKIADDLIVASMMKRAR